MFFYLFCTKILWLSETVSDIMLLISYGDIYQMINKEER